MSKREGPTTAPQALMTIGIITFALVTGVAMFAVIVIAVVRSKQVFEGDPWALEGTLTPIALLFAASMIPMSLLIPNLIAKQQFQGMKGATLAAGGESAGFEGWGRAAAELLPIFTTTHIIRMALLEGAAFFCLIAFMIEGKALALLAAAILLILMIAAYPTQSRVRNWLEEARNQLPTF